MDFRGAFNPLNLCGCMVPARNRQGIQVVFLYPLARFLKILVCPILEQYLLHLHAFLLQAPHIRVGILSNQVRTAKQKIKSYITS